MSRAQDSTFEGVGRAIDEATMLLERANAGEHKLPDILPTILIRQLLALNRLTDIAESLQAKLADLEQRVRSLENDR